MKAAGLDGVDLRKAVDEVGGFVFRNCVWAARESPGAQAAREGVPGLEDAWAVRALEGGWRGKAGARRKAGKASAGKAGEAKEGLLVKETLYIELNGYEIDLGPLYPDGSMWTWLRKTQDCLSASAFVLCGPPPAARRLPPGARGRRPRPPDWSG